MREDLNKQLCERERRGHERKYREVRRSKKFRIRDPDGEDARSFESIKLRYGYDTKDFSENLNPLLGQIRKAVNRPWDKFYSDLSKVFDKRSVINQHILTHLDDFLERNIYVREDGALFRRGRYGGRDEPLAEMSSEFYVDPRDGIIKRNKHYGKKNSPWRIREAKYAEEEAAKFRALPDGDVMHKIGDVWFVFVVKVAPIGRYIYEKPAGVELFKPHKWSKETSWDRLKDYERKHCGVRRFVGESVVDVSSGETVFSEEGQPPKKYYAAKRTASHKLLKQVGLVS